MNRSSILKRFPDLRILVVGDIMLDRYIRGQVKRISPEAPVPVLKVSDESFSTGGAANVAKNLKSLGASVEIFGIVGDDADGEMLIGLLKRMRIDAKAIIPDPGRPTTTKTRLIAGNQQITRIDKEESNPISDTLKNDILALLSKSLDESAPDGIIISDYAKGLIRNDLAQEIIRLAKRRGIFVAVDPKGKDFAKYRGAGVITPNQKETEDVCGFPIEDEKTLRKAAHFLLDQTDAQTVLITRGRHGISFCVRGGEIKTVPSEAREVFDVTGAGDTVVSTFTLSYLSSRSWEDSVEIANRAAGIVVGRVGAAAVTQSDLLGLMENEKSPADKKVFTRESLSETISRLRGNGKKIIFTNGCFDLLHAGHMKLLREAKNLGEVLIVAINSDDSIRRLKGDGRPLTTENDRAEIIAALDFVDYVIIFGEDTPIELIKTLKPDVLVKGGDYTPGAVIGRDFVEGYGGKVVIVPLVEGTSTSSLIDRIRKG